MPKFIHILKECPLDESIAPTWVIVNINTIASIFELHGTQADSMYTRISLTTGEVFDSAEPLSYFFKMLDPLSDCAAIE